ncbi:MAG: M28 family peptidase [Tepidisphaeraceae bacterium]
MKRVILLLTLLGGCVTNMPGKSFQGALPPQTPDEVSLQKTLTAHVHALAGQIGDRNILRAGSLERATSFIETTWRAQGYDVIEQRYDCGGLTVRNLSVEIPGTTRPRDIIIVGAHYDSVPGCPAANDNASGVAAMLEVSRLLRDSRPARTIRFVAFVNEEPPYFQTDAMGSVVCAKACKANQERIVAMLSLETIGSYSDKPNSQQYPEPFDKFYPSTGNFIAFVGNLSSASLVKRCVGSFRSHTQFPSEGGAAPGWVTGVGWSDHWSFWQQGYSAIMITDTAPFRYAHYHEPSDTPDKLDYERMARVVAGIARVVRELAQG